MYEIVSLPRWTPSIFCPDILSLQQPSGVFAGDSFGEVDTRFSYVAVQALALLGRLSSLDVDKTVSYVLKCKNFDGGFGSTIGAESHAAQGTCRRLLHNIMQSKYHHSFRLCITVGYFGQPSSHRPRSPGLVAS